MLEDVAPGLIDNSAVLAEEQQRLRIDRSLVTARKGIFDEKKKGKLIGGFEAAREERAIGELQIDLDYQNQLSNARRQFGALTEEFETAKRLLEELRDIKLDNLHRQTDLLGKTLEDSVVSGFDKFLGGFRDGVDGLDDLWRDFALGFLDVWANVLQQAAQQKLVELLFRGGSSSNDSGNGIGGFIGDVIGAVATANDGLMLEQEHIPNYYRGSGINPLSLYAGVQDAFRRESAAGGQPVLVVASVGERILSPWETANYNRMESSGIVDAWTAAGVNPDKYQINNYNGGGQIGKSVSNAVNNFTNNNSSHSSSNDSHDSHYYDFGRSGSKKDRLGRSDRQRADKAYKDAQKRRNNKGYQ